MNHSGDAAEQIVRMSLEGVEVAAKITGNAAKEMAMLLLAAMKSPDKSGGLKLKGKARMSSMLKSGKALEIYSVKESDLKKFYQGAKQYGIVYCVLRDSKSDKDGLCDILVKAEDAPKIARVAERFKFATVDKAKIESEIVAAKAEKAANEKVDSNQPKETLGINDTTKESQIKEVTDNSPLAPEPLGKGLSENALEREKKPEKVITKPSVKEELREIKAAQKAKESDSTVRDDKAKDENVKPNPTTTHTQPPRGKAKTRKSKGR